MTRDARGVTVLRSWQQVVAIVFAALALLACKIVERVQVEKDGSGLYQAEVTIEAWELDMLPRIKAELAKDPRYRLVEEGPRYGGHYLLLERRFHSLEELNEKTSEFYWTVGGDPAAGEAGTSAGSESIFRRRFRLELRNLPAELGAPEPTEHTIEITVPGRVLDTSGRQVGRNKVVWDRLAAGPRGYLYIEGHAVSFPWSSFGGEGAHRTTPASRIALAALVVLLLVLVILRQRSRRRPEAPPSE